MADLPIKVLVVDDSGFMRLLITNMLAEDPELFIVDSATNGLEAYTKTQEHSPDVIVLDLIMEGYDGVYAVKKIMNHHPCPIILLSSLDANESEIVIQALEEGAYDFVSKPQGAFHSKLREVKEQLIQCIKQAAKVNIASLQQAMKKNSLPHSFEKTLNYKIIVIGASTGGTTAIESILVKIPENLPIPIVIAQHIPQSFGESFTKRLNRLIPLPVNMAFEGTTLKNGMVYVLPSHSNTELVFGNPTKEIRFQATSKKFLYNHPSIDCLLMSTARIFHQQTLSVLLTGMGRDGALGTEAIYQEGGYTIVQDESSSVVFGMPKAAIELGCARQVLPLSEISNFIVSCL